MRFGALRSVAHNLGDSISSGLGLPVGWYGFDIFAEAKNSTAGHVEIDFVAGEMRGAMPSNVLSEAILRYSAWLHELAAKHGGRADEFAELTIRFAEGGAYGKHFIVTVADRKGRRDVSTYEGYGGKTLARERAG